MKKLKSVILSYLILLTLLISSFSVYVPKALAQGIPAPTPQHVSFEAVSNQEIIHHYTVNGVAAEHSFKPPYIVPGSNLLISENTYASNEHLVYETGFRDIYFAVNLDKYRSSGLFKKNSSNKLERLTFSGPEFVAQGTPEITDLQDQKYIFLLSRVSYHANINKMTPDTLPSKNLPVDTIKVTVKYNQESEGYKNLKPEHLARAQQGLPPENMPCYLFFAPETSISFSHAEIKKANIDRDGNLDFGTINAHKGWYKAICQFHIMTPNVSDGYEKAYFDWDQTWYEAGFYKGVLSWASTVAGTVGNTVWTIASWVGIEDNGGTAATAWLRDNYWSAYSFHVSDLDTTTSIALEDMEMKNETELNNSLTALGNKSTEEGVCSSGGTDIISLLTEAMCGMAVMVKNAADAVFNWAKHWLELSLGVVRNEDTDVQDKIDKLNVESGSNTGKEVKSTGESSSTGGTTPTNGGTTTEEAGVQFRVLANVRIANEAHYAELLQAVTSGNINKPNENSSAVWIKIGPIDQSGNWVSNSQHTFYGKAEYYQWDVTNLTAKVKFTATQTLPQAYPAIGIMGGKGTDTRLFLIRVEYSHVNDGSWHTYQSN